MEWVLKIPMYLLLAMVELVAKFAALVRTLGSHVLVCDPCVEKKKLQFEEELLEHKMVLNRRI
mgnify:CR=1 FL=1